MIIPDFKHNVFEILVLLSIIGIHHFLFLLYVRYTHYYIMNDE